jgi:hypothetical protein
MYFRYFSISLFIRLCSPLNVCSFRPLSRSVLLSIFVRGRFYFSSIFLQTAHSSGVKIFFNSFLRFPVSFFYLQVGLMDGHTGPLLHSHPLTLSSSHLPIFPSSDSQLSILSSQRSIFLQTAHSSGVKIFFNSFLRFPVSPFPSFICR